jgi:hypothetical protein
MQVRRVGVVGYRELGFDPLMSETPRLNAPD